MFLQLRYARGGNVGLSATERAVQWPSGAPSGAWLRSERCRRGQRCRRTANTICWQQRVSSDLGVPLAPALPEQEAQGCQAEQASAAAEETLPMRHEQSPG